MLIFDKILFSNCSSIHFVAPKPVFTYLGCYNDTGVEYNGTMIPSPDRALRGSMIYNQQNMSIDRCISHCRLLGKSILICSTNIP